MIIRIATLQDLPRIVAIYNQAIEVGGVTADLTPFTIEERKNWFLEHDKDTYPIYVLEDAGKIVCWGSLSPYRKGREGLKTTAEISYYVDYNFHGKGYGKKMIAYILEDCKRVNIQNVFGVLMEVNKSSSSILEKFGFSQWGFFPNIVSLDGKQSGHLIYGLNIN